MTTSELGGSPPFFDLVGQVRAMRRFEVALHEADDHAWFAIGFPVGRFGPVSRRPAERTCFGRWGNLDASAWNEGPVS